MNKGMVKMTHNMAYTELNHKLSKLKNDFNNKPYPSYSQRRENILFIKKALKENEDGLYKALAKDFGHRSHYDSLLSDLLPTMQFIKYTCKNLKKWMKPSKRHSGLLLSPSQVSVIYQPVGVIGIIVPWNFPLYLSIPPIVTAIAAGNKVIVKMSEFTPETNQILIRALKNLKDEIIFIEGDGEVGQAFSTLEFDHLFFTGSTHIGKKVSIEAAKNLVPVTLELGGKSPAIIKSKSLLTHAAKSLVIGKVINSGQVCVAPDYVMMPQNWIDEFINLYKKYYQELNFEQKGIFQLTFQHNHHHFKRTTTLLDDAVKKGALIHKLDDSKLNDNQLAPLLLTQVNYDMLIMQEEIFHPILPIIPIESNDQCLDYIKKNDKPLALYLFTKNLQDEQFFKQKVISGGVSINDTLTHVAVDDAPFGGVGQSGIGHYHGIEGFRRFSHGKTVFKAPSFFSKNYFLLKHRHFFFKWLRKLL